MAWIIIKIKGKWGRRIKKNCYKSIKSYLISLRRIWVISKIKGKRIKWRKIIYLDIIELKLRNER